MKEIWLRLKEPLNTFWRRAMYIFGLLGAGAAFVTEVLLPVLIDPEVSHELKDLLRPLYGWCIGIASAARLTVQNPDLIKHKKEFNDKLEDHG